MPRPFSRSAVHTFADRDRALTLARDAAAQLAAACPAVTRVVLFGSYARDDYTLKSDLDLLVVVSRSGSERSERVTDFLAHLPVYPIDVFPYTEDELQAAALAGDPFVARALREGIEVFRREADS